MRVFAALLVLAGAFAVAVAGLVLPGCTKGPDASSALKAEALAASHRACTSEARAVKAMALALGKSCEVQAAELNELVHTNPDCKAYFGDATITVSDVCSQ